MLAHRAQLFFFQQPIATGNHRLFQTKFLLELLFEPQVLVVVIVDGDGDNALLTAALQQATNGGAIDPQLASDLRLGHILLVIELGDFDNQPDIIAVFHSHLLAPAHLCKSRVCAVDLI